MNDEDARSHEDVVRSIAEKLVDSGCMVEGQYAPHMFRETDYESMYQELMGSQWALKVTIKRVGRLRKSMVRAVEELYQIGGLSWAVNTTEAEWGMDEETAKNRIGQYLCGDGRE